MGKKYMITNLLVFSFWGALQAQVPNYTQYNQSVLFTNPSLVGTKSEASITAQYRGQEMAAGDKSTNTLLTGLYPLFNKTTGRRQGGLGFSFVHDIKGQNENLVLQGLAATYAYNLALTNRDYLSFGMLAGYFQQKISTNGVTTGNQWTNLNGYDPFLPTGENMDRERKGFLSLGAGFNYYQEDEEERHVASFGVSAFHLNRPNVSFYNDPSALSIQYSVQGYMAMFKNQDWHIGPEAYYNYWHGQHFVQAAAVARYYFKNQNPFDLLKDGSIAFKGGYRSEHYALLGIALQQPNFQVGLSYDMGVAGASVPGNAIEVTFTLKKLFRKKRSVLSLSSDYTLGEVKDIYFNEVGKEPVKGNDSQLPASKGNYAIELRKDFKFGFNETALNKEAMEYLDELASLLEAHLGTYLEVIGHTDDVGSSEANEKVSLLRAEAVINYLVEKGIDNKRLKATGKGNTAPLLPNDSEDNRAKNRRVEFIIYE